MAKTHKRTRRIALRWRAGSFIRNEALGVPVASCGQAVIGAVGASRFWINVTCKKCRRLAPIKWRKKWETER
jgi:hypothetical protein